MSIQARRLVNHTMQIELQADNGKHITVTTECEISIIFFFFGKFIVSMNTYSSSEVKPHPTNSVGRCPTWMPASCTHDIQSCTGGRKRKLIIY